MTLTRCHSTFHKILQKILIYKRRYSKGRCEKSIKNNCINDKKYNHYLTSAAIPIWIRHLIYHKSKSNNRCLQISIKQSCVLCDKCFRHLRIHFDQSLVFLANSGFWERNWTGINIGSGWTSSTRQFGSIFKRCSLKYRKGQDSQDKLVILIKIVAQIHHGWC